MAQHTKSTVAATLDIIAGVHGLLGGIVLLVLATVGRLGHAGWTAHYGTALAGLLTSAFFLVLGFVHLVAGILALAGGLFTLQRRTWGWALTGGVAALFAGVLLGIPAMILTVLAESELHPAVAQPA